VVQRVDLRTISVGAWRRRTLSGRALGQPEVVKNLEFHNPDDPSAEWGFTSEGLALAPSGEQAFLHDIFGLMVLPARLSA
jgi:hypothetical protein